MTGWKTTYLGTKWIELDVDEIVGKQRPRHTRQGRVYTPPKTTAFENLVALMWKAEHGASMAGHDGPVRVHIHTSRQLAKSNPRFWLGRADTGKPDIDNIAKSVLDALNGVAYRDDSQVVGLNIEKKERTEHGDGNTLTISVAYYEERHEK